MLEAVTISWLRSQAGQDQQDLCVTLCSFGTVSGMCQECKTNLYVLTVITNKYVDHNSAVQVSFMRQLLEAVRKLPFPWAMLDGSELLKKVLQLQKFRYAAVCANIVACCACLDGFMQCYAGPLLLSHFVTGHIAYPRAPSSGWHAFE